jgi:hypothetical protein
MEYAYRRGGEAVYVNGRRQLGEAQYAGLTDARRKSGAWMRLVRDPEVFAKGAIRHPDHATIRLTGWHRVLMNTEQRSRAKLHVTFID